MLLSKFSVPYAPAREHDELVRAIHINREDLSTEFTNFPGWLAYWGERHGEASAEVALAKAKLENAADALRDTEARVEMDLREGATKMAGKKPTEGVLEAMTRINPRVMEARGEIRAARLELAQAEQRKGQAWAIIRALEAKHDMLVQLGADARVAMQTVDPTMKSQRSAAK